MAEVAPGQAGRLYAETRGRLRNLVRDAGDDVGALPVPTCPKWTVQDVLAHVSGVCADILGGRLDGIASEPWTARQVDERRDWSVEKIIEEWQTNAPQCEELSQHFPGGADIQWMADLVTHEHDIRTALAKPGARDFEGIRLGMTWLIEAISNGFSPAFRITTPEGEDLVLGGGDVTASVRAHRFEMFRAITGRRSREQIESFDWDADCELFLGAFSLGPFTMAASPIAE
jgi:uncharacterized protein (TIGR03083 family)